MNAEDEAFEFAEKLNQLRAERNTDCWFGWANCNCRAAWHRNRVDEADGKDE